ncbi:MAG: hypothetical protein Q8R25_03785 [bacterium]|nr:hypothetical protein [bacterium]
MYGTPAKGNHVPEIVVADPNDTQWLYDYVKRTGNVREMWHSKIAMRTFSPPYPTNKGPYPVSCLDVMIEVPLDESSARWNLFVFDSVCSLPFHLSDRTIRVSGNVRLVIDARNGTLGLGSSPWVVDQGRPVFADELATRELIRSVFSAIVREQKEYIERFPDAD